MAGSLRRDRTKRGVEVAEFYYNLKTGEVEDGHQSTWTSLMGPYPTREEAEQALETARRRNEAWDEDD
jgi:hypothetical protein